MAWADEAERAFEAEYSGPGMAQGDAGPDLSVGMTGVGHPGQALGHEVSQVAGVEPPASIAADLQWSGDFGASNSWEGISNDIGALDRMVREMQASDALTARENLNRDTSNVTQTDSMLGYDKAMRQGWAGEGQEDNSAFWGSGSEEPDMDSQQAFAEAEAEYSKSFAGIGSDVEQFLSAAGQVDVPGLSPDMNVDWSKVRASQRPGYVPDVNPYDFTGVPGGGQKVPGQIDLGLPADFQAALDEQAQTGFAPIQSAETMRPDYLNISGMDAPFWSGQTASPVATAAAVSSSGDTSQAATTQAAPTQISQTGSMQEKAAAVEKAVQENPGETATSIIGKILNGVLQFVPGYGIVKALTGGGMPKVGSPQTKLSPEDEWISGGAQGFYRGRANKYGYRSPPRPGLAPWQTHDPQTGKSRPNVGWFTNPLTGERTPYGPSVQLDTTHPAWLEHGSRGDAGELGWFYKKYPWATGLSSQIVQRAIQDGEFLRELIRAAEADELWLYT